MPGIEKRDRIDLAASDLPVCEHGRAGDPEVQMRRRVPGTTGYADEAEKLSLFDAHTRLDPVGDCRQVRAVIAHTVVTDERDVQTPAIGAIVDVRIPDIDSGHSLNDTRNDGNKGGPFRGEDVGCQIGMAARRVGAGVGRIEREDMTR